MHGLGADMTSDKLAIRTVADVREAIKEITESGDEEKRHRLEDEMYVNVLKAIAKGQSHAPTLAKEALKVAAMDFVRWYA
jgi:hypothetical protein